MKSYIDQSKRKILPEIIEKYTFLTQADKLFFIMLIEEYNRQRELIEQLESLIESKNNHLKIYEKLFDDNFISNPAPRATPTGKIIKLNK